MGLVQARVALRIVARMESIMEMPIRQDLRTVREIRLETVKTATNREHRTAQVQKGMVAAVTASAE
jgi:hypothetical protein